MWVFVWGTLVSGLGGPELPLPPPPPPPPLSEGGWLTETGALQSNADLSSLHTRISLVGPVASGSTMKAPHGRRPPARQVGTAVRHALPVRTVIGEPTRDARPGHLGVQLGTVDL